MRRSLQAGPPRGGPGTPRPTWPRGSKTRGALARFSLRRKQRHAFLRVKDVAVDESQDLRLPPFHRSGQADPVQDLVLARVVDLLRRQVTPLPQITRLEL